MIRSLVRFGVCVLVVTGLSVVGAPSPVVAAATREVVVTGGAIAGVVSDGVVEYLGIPFAGSTGGAARFGAPRPVSGWSGARSARGHGPQCPQNGYLPALPTAGPTGEDCLTIDVYAPDGAVGRNLPVMVFFHGGGYTTGSNAQYDAPTRMVAEGDVIVAVPNYRLGPFGFLSLPELAAESGGATGTVGIQDQQAALRWVRDNARAFGGDPGAVTIFGESAGGGSVCTHFAAPGSDGLYDKAIVQSGSCARSPLVPGGRADSFARSARFADSVGCGDPATRLACLRGLPAERLLDASAGQSDDSTPTWVPVIDGVVVTRDLEAALRDRVDRIPLIVGSNGDEGAQFVAESDYARGRIPDAESYQSYVRWTFGTYADAILARYPVADYPSPAAAQSAVITDGLFACPALWTGRLARDAGHPVWQYEFDEAPLGDGNPLLPGAFHSAELFYLFNGVFGVPLPWTGASAVFGEQMRRWWTTFAHTGDPNAPGSGPWSAWPGPPGDGAVLIMRATGSFMSDDFPVRHHCEFWAARPM
ncbi:carboxylesterase/lipase family protein [Nocardia bovistercoris]|uniref:Carboxylic ester hydrolase n=1 Tax=Nocardia bovistercoris TaxID=2785916 RepID=A0A931I520_9NOCA|nr:carboxylesterase family protein [Nocardia bovistercoris]MBH0775002.1 carboxylesterase family protein [Nocardia bovistercoris]